jgi:hypothetical protein
MGWKPVGTVYEWEDDPKPKVAGCGCLGLIVTCAVFLFRSCSLPPPPPQQEIQRPSSAVAGKVVPSGIDPGPAPKEPGKGPITSTSLRVFAQLGGPIVAEDVTLVLGESPPVTLKLTPRRPFHEVTLRLPQPGTYPWSVEATTTWGQGTTRILRGAGSGTVAIRGGERLMVIRDFSGGTQSGTFRLHLDDPSRFGIKPLR